MTAPSLSIPLDQDLSDQLYSIPGAHGTLAPITTSQEHYDSRQHADDDVAKTYLEFGDVLVGREVELERLREVYFYDGVDDDDDSGNDGESGSDGGESDYSSGKVVFVKGYSGVGKSHLIRHFVKQMKDEQSSSSKGGSDVSDSDTGSGCKVPLCGEGKFNDSGIPFSAFGELLESLVCELESTDLAEVIKKEIGESPELGSDTDGDHVLRETWPALVPLLGEDNSEDAEETPQRIMKKRSSQSIASSTIAMTSIKEYTLALLKLICSITKNINDKSSKKKTNSHPVLILFLDDLQWADPPSLDLLSYLLSELTQNIMFICAYRSNEVGPNHPLQAIIQETTLPQHDDCTSSQSSTPNLNKLELYPLSSPIIQQYIATILNKDPSQVTDLSQVIYKKTMGNIFYVRHAMEELVRKNALYYDVMCFEWNFVCNDEEVLKDYISDDVVSSVRGKIDDLDEALIRVLVVMGYIPNIVDGAVLLKLVVGTGMEIDNNGLISLLELGVKEGMLLLSSKCSCHVFAHDKIRQASKECIEGEERDELLLQLSRVLLDMHQENQVDTEWCVFVAVDYLNLFEPGVKMDALEVTRLNVQVAGCARKRGAVEKEYGLLEYALRGLKVADVLWEEYELTLQVYNGLVISARLLGKFDESKSNVEEGLYHARSLDDKLIAYRHKIANVHAETRDYSKSLEEAINVLRIYGYDFHLMPSAAECVKQEMKVKMALHHRPYSSLLDKPLVESPLMGLFKEATQFALVSGNDRFLKILCWKAIRLGLLKGIDVQFHTILVCLGNVLAKEKEIKTAVEIATTAVAMSERYSSDKGNTAYTKLVAYQGILPQLQSFRSGVDALFQCYKDLRLDGQIEPALGGAMMHFFTIFACGVSLGPLIESKLVLVEKFAKKSGMSSFVSIFQMQRQFLMNLRKESEYPTEFKGTAFNEEETLAGLDPTSKVYSMNLRDTSTFKLILSFLFHDRSGMAKMLDVLRDYPISDMSVPRLHLRLSFMGLSALVLKKTKTEYNDIIKRCMAHFKELSKLGSVNALPVYHFMLALKQPSIQAFELAINSCSDAQFLHMEAMVKEHYGLFLCQDSDNSSIGEDYLVSSYWSYFHWGAHGKTMAMLGEHMCIKTASKNQSNVRISLALSSTSGNSSQKHQEQNLSKDKNKRFSLRSFGKKSVSHALRRKSLDRSSHSKSEAQIFAKPES